MVFCYKIITESPRRVLSPRKTSPTPASNVPSSISQLIRAYDYETDTELLNAIPEREWRLLAALAKKREEHDEREKLAVQFRKLWQREQEERKMVEAETLIQYKRYIVEKRREEQSRLEYKQHLKTMEMQLRRKELLDNIKNKEQRSANLLAYIDDKKASLIIDRALEDEARAQLAADRRTRNSEVEEFKKHVELIGTQRRSDDAMKRRAAMLKDASQRVAINNALNHWESALLRQEMSAMEAAKRAHHAARAALTDARCMRLARARDAKHRRARKMAYITEQLRDAIRLGRV
uniref:Trichohyalin-plectin-homology domain-containing protein n=1 Tax=Heliothis virescens TaxID=7102 RepID=A0A2A4ITL0_HELVI